MGPMTPEEKQRAIAAQNNAVTTHEQTAMYEDTVMCHTTHHRISTFLSFLRHLLQVSIPLPAGR
jgi:hypothetical protein